jgi:molybdate transport system substrate-binding protein
MKMKRVICLFVVFVLFLAGCVPSATPASPTDPRTLNVFAAASLTDAFTEIGKNFEAANPRVMITFNFAGSQALRTQIEEGAPADVFASANKTEMDTLVAGAFVTQGTAQIFLNNKLVVILPANNPATFENLEDLARPGIKLVLAAEEVPVGKYARQALDQMDGQFGDDFKNKVLANVVSNEDNVKQVVAKVQLGEADAGIVYTSDAVAAPKLKRIEIPAELNVIAEYPIAPLAQSANADLSNAFIAYVLSDDGQTVLQKWGFASPG